jgi:hypothetical protein
MKQFTVVVKPFCVAAILKAIADLGLTACVAREAKGYSRQKGYLDRYAGSEYSMAFLPKVEITVWVSDDRAGVGGTWRKARTTSRSSCNATMNGPMMAWFSGLNTTADEAGFVVVYPNGTGANSSFTWNGGAEGDGEVVAPRRVPPGPAPWHPEADAGRCGDQTSRTAREGEATHAPQEALLQCPRPCGSGKQDKLRCYGKGVEDGEGSGAGPQHPQHPGGTVATSGRLLVTCSDWQGRI